MEYAMTALKILGFLAIFSLVFGFSLKLPLTDFFHSLKRIRLILRSFLSNFVIIPLFTLGLCSAFQLPLAASTAMLLLSFAPYAPAIPKLAWKTQGDLSLALSLMVLSGFFSILMTPWLCERLLSVLPGSSPIQVDGSGILRSLATSIFLPFLLGIFAHDLWPAMALRVSTWAERFANIVLPLLVLIVLVSRFQSIRHIDGSIVLAMFTAALAFGVVGYNFSDSQESARRATAFGSELRHPSVAIYLGTEYFPELQVSPFIVVFFLMSAVLAVVLRKIWSAADARREETRSRASRITALHNEKEIFHG
jgi:predicted Na+-dependent transporter